jgi:hypothetical protein
MHRVLMSASAPVAGFVALLILNWFFQTGGLTSLMMTRSLHWLEPPWASVTVRVDSVHGCAFEVCRPQRYPPSAPRQSQGNVNGRESKRVIHPFFNAAYAAINYV